MPNRKYRSHNRSTLLQMNHTGPNFNLMNSFDTNQTGGSPFVRLIDDEQRQIKKLDLNIRRPDKLFVILVCYGGETAVSRPPQKRSPQRLPPSASTRYRCQISQTPSLPPVESGLTPLGASWRISTRAGGTIIRASTRVCSARSCRTTSQASPPSTGLIRC